MKYILTDIEGTTTSISFVHEILFPYSKERLPSFLIENQNNATVTKIIENIPGTLNEKTRILINWIDTDKKEKALKDLQGLIWNEGYSSGKIKGHLYPDVNSKLCEWKNFGIKLGVYSSGSIQAQKLLFKYSVEGNLDELFSNNFDTSIGHKRETSSYQSIVKIINLNPNEILFLSDIKEELDAAKLAGLHTVQLVREENIDFQGHTQAKSFNDIIIN